MGIDFNTFKKTLFLFIRQIDFKNSTVRLRLTLALSLILVDVAVASLIPYYSKVIVDSLAGNIINTVWVAVFLLGALWILEKTINHIQEIIFFPIVNNAIRNLTYKVVEHIHHVSLPDYQKLSIPEVVNCIRRISMSARAFIKILFLMILPTTIKLLIALAITIRIGLFGFLLLPAVFIAILMLYKGTQWYVSTRELAWQTTDKVVMRINDSILNTKIIRPYKLFEMVHLKNLLDFEAQCWYQTNTRLHSIHIAIGLILGATITAILACAIFSIQKHHLTVGDFVLLKGQLIAAFLPFRIFSGEFRQLAESLVDIKKIIQIFEISRENYTPKPQLLSDLKKSNEGILCTEVFFCHPLKKPIFKNLSLQCYFGEKIGIIGKTGCGKSTLINLIAGLYVPSQGHVYIQGQNVHALSNVPLKARIHYIPQDFRLFNLSLSYNITYGMSDVSEASLLSVLEAVGLMEVVQQMPAGLDTVVGEMGIKLSAGEKQKVALARALLLKPDILLLDEATSSLNVESEKSILNILYSHIPTIILTSHRLSTLEGLDRIFKIEEGLLNEIDLSYIQSTDSTLFHAAPEYA